ncbi:LysM domain-containing protein [Neolewinella xylanilytica]|uniref:LysM domain-containing protein n=1 Tax=Neolewinella xylanilytica TaxID=1514080 RepID=A0A2S6I5D6_9BACT|nr:LysM peptidoglycan-binding domain-containing protein [Neolewinella xylanilytica]PPK86362.1 LysM domain-containing protein [Neolewinella xylanilytica]
MEFRFGALPASPYLRWVYDLVYPLYCCHHMGTFPKYFLLLFFAACFSTPEAGATGDSLYFLLPSDTVVVRFDALSGHLLFDHQLAPRQTLYGAARFYGHSLNDIYRLNPELQLGYKPGTRVTVSIPKAALRPSFSRDSLAWYVPVRYRLSPGETLYGLSRRTLSQPNDSLIRKLNPGVNPQDLEPGRVLTIGYLRIDGIDPDSQVKIEDRYVLQNRDLRLEWDTTMSERRLKYTNGKAAWTNRGDQNKWMVLHRTAPIGSIIEIEDPRSRKTIYAEVVARIPEEVYDSRVVLVVSPRLVRAFGVRDKEFYVRTRHL